MSTPSTPIQIPKSPSSQLAHSPSIKPVPTPFTMQAAQHMPRTPPVEETSKQPVYGLTYPRGLLDSLPILEKVELPPAPETDAPTPSNYPFLEAESKLASPVRPEPSVSTQVRLLPLSTFSSMHLRSTVSHAPDNVLFPFLHGLEESNTAQSTFFLSPSQVEQGVDVPRYRGLMWVVCEEDLDTYLAEHPPAHHIRRLGRGGEWSDGDSEFDDLDMDEDMELDDEEDEFVGSEPGNVDEAELAAKRDNDLSAMDVDPNDAPHMHPVQPRPLPAIQTHFTAPLAPAFVPSSAPAAPLFTSSPSTPSAAVVDSTSVHASPPFSYGPVAEGDTTISAGHDRRASNASTTSSAYTNYTNDSNGSWAPSSPASSWAPGSPTSGAWVGSTPCSPTIAEESMESRPVAESAVLPPGTPSPSPPPQTKVTECPLLTSSFHTHELLKTRWVAEGKYDGRKEVRLAADSKAEFVPLKVPDGISLRNFGIQVPIMATLSDIVVYSPKGRSPAAVQLAQRFAEAIDKKKAERDARRARRNDGTALADPKLSKSMGYAETKAILGGSLPSVESMASVAGFYADIEDESAEGALSYNVFLLDATIEEMSRSVPHLMVRFIDGEDILPCGKDKDHLTGSHTDGTDGHVDGEGMNVDMDTATGAERTDTRPCKKAHAKESLHELAHRPNTVNFALREREEMRDLTKASEIISVFPLALYPSGAKSPSQSGTKSTSAGRWDPAVGEVYLGNSNDVPVVPDAPAARPYYPKPASASNYTSSPYVFPSGSTVKPEDDPFNFFNNDPAFGMGYDICVECHDMAPFPSVASLVSADEQLHRLDAEWAAREGSEGEVRPSPNAKSVIHLPFPSSPPSNAATLAALLPVVRFLERWLQPPQPASAMSPPVPGTTPENSQGRASSPAPLPGTSYPPLNTHTPMFSATRTRSSTFSINAPHATTVLPVPPTFIAPRTRPLKVLVYSSDGYTESSVMALCLLMAVKRMTLPEAYLELQVGKKRSFFVYQPDLAVLQRVESRLIADRDQERKRVGEMGRARMGQSIGPGQGVVSNRDKEKRGDVGRQWMGYPNASANTEVHPGFTRTNSGYRPAANSVSSSFGSPLQVGADPSSLPPQPLPVVQLSQQIKSRPRASTSPWLPSLFPDHQTWFGDPRFDGSFPSRVLPFLYLGNLNHATNAYMLHALGITHVVSVGECALVPPSANATAASCHRPSAGAQFVAGKGPGGQGSLWIEEREGRIKVLDIKGVCDDGIDTLEPQLEPICAWIEKARAEGGQVLVHCRVGVSRSATVTIAYVMKHLALPLVDAYLIVRSRRLSVLIQPNMRLLYNLCGWEIRLARERAGGDEDRLRVELARSLTWPFLSKEVHALNEKYLSN